MKTIIIIAFVACLASFAYTAQVYWTGTYEVDTILIGDLATCCFPASDVVMTQTAPGSEVDVEWTYSKSAVCGTKSGVTTYASAVPAAGDTLDVFTVTSTVESGEQYEILLPQAGVPGHWATTTGTSCKILIVKSAYLLGLGALIVLSFSYLLL